MDKDDQELVRHLFAALSGRVEQVHDLAVTGQAGLLSVKEQGDLTRRLEVAVADVAALARALAVLISDDDMSGNTGRS